MAATAIGGSAERALERKDKAPLPIPVSLGLHCLSLHLTFPTPVLLLEISSHQGEFILIPKNRLCHILFFRSSPISCTQSKYGAVLFFFCHAQFRRVVVWILVVRVTICDYSTRWVRLTPCIRSPGRGLNWGSVASIVGIICERFGVLCSQAGFSPHWANVYLECITFISIRCVSLCLCACESTAPVSKNSWDSSNAGF